MVSVKCFVAIVLLTGEEWYENFIEFEFWVKFVFELGSKMVTVKMEEDFFHTMNTPGSWPNNSNLEPKPQFCFI